MKASAKYVMRRGQIVVTGEEPESPEIAIIQIAQRELEIIVLVTLQDKTLKMSLAC